MGMTPAKTFPFPTAYGASPDSNVLAQAKAAPQAPPTNFSPLNPQAVPQQPQAQGQQQGLPMQRINRYYHYGGMDGGPNPHGRFYD